MKKIFSVAILISMAINVYSQDSLARELINKDRGEDIVTHIRFLQKHSTNPEEEINAYVNSLWPSIPIENITAYYLTRFQMSCEAEKPRDILFYANIYLALGQEEDLATVYTSAAKAAAAVGDDSLAQGYLTKLKIYSEENEGWFEEEISELTTEIDNIQKERIKLERWYNWNDGVKGIWINKYYNTIIIIEDPADGSGATLILGDTKTRLKKEKGKWTVKIIPKELNISQSIQFDGPNKAISIQFASQRIRDRAWLKGISMAGLELSRTIRTEANAYIRTSDGSTNRKITETYITEQTANLADDLFKVLTVSSRKEEFRSFSMAAVTDNMMKSENFYSHIEVYSDGRNRSNNYSHQSEFFRCEEEDSVFLILKNGNLYFAGSIESNSPELREYKRIKWYNSFLNPRFLIPTIITAGASGKLIHESINCLIQTEYLSYRYIYMFTIGVTLIAALPLSIIIESGSGNQKGANNVLYRDFNQRHMGRLRRKMQTTLSFAPTYTPETYALCASVNLSF